MIQISCTGLLNIELNKVINVTFTRFNFENSLDCKFDWVQVSHDIVVLKEILFN